MNDVVVFFGLDRAFIKETKEVKRNEKQKKIASWVFLAYFEAFHSGYFHQASYF